MAIFDKIGEFAKSTTEKAGDKIEITRINGRIRTEQQTIQGFKAELGARYWDKIASGELEADPGVADIVERIKASLANIVGFEGEIRRIEEERAAAEAAAKAAAEAAARAAAEAKAAAAAPPVVPPAAPAQPQYAPAVQPQAYAPQPLAGEPQQAPASGMEGGASVQGEYHFGAPSQPAATQPAAPAQQPAAPAQPAVGFKCANCGVPLVPGTKFCQECGTPAPAPAAPAKRFCSNCGTELKPEIRFCPECGTKA